MSRNALGPALTLLSITRSKFVSVVDAFPDERWSDAPSAGRWSAAEIVAHTMQVEERIILSSRKTLLKPPYKVPFLKKFHLPLVLASTRIRKLESPIPLDPAKVPAKSDYLARVTGVRAATLQFTAETESQDLGPFTFPHPVFGPLNLYGWLRLIAYHELRHAKQIREVAEIFHR